MQYMITKITEKQTKKGDPYLVLTLSTEKEVVEAKYWNCSAKQFKYEVGCIVDTVLTVNEFAGAKDYVCNGTMAQVPNADPNKFIPSVENVDDLYEQIMEQVEYLRPSLKELVKAIYTDYKGNILSSPAAKTVHHNLKGGLMLHTYQMLLMAMSLDGVYKESMIDMDMVYAGILLHDIGKLQELSISAIGEITYTPKGNLLGHMPLGYALVSEYGKRLGTDPEDLMVLEHIILAHQGLREYESCAIPSVPEAWLVHVLDSLDAKIYQLNRIYTDMDNGSSSEKPFPTLAGSRPYKRLPLPFEMETVEEDGEEKEEQDET